MKKAIVLATLVVVLLPVALVAKDSKDSGNSLVRFEAGIGVHPVSNVSGAAKADGSCPNVTRKVVRGVNPAGQLWVIADLRADVIDMCITNRHYRHKRAGSSEAVMKDRRSSGRCRAFLVIRHSAVMSSSRLSGRPLASVALKWVQTNSSGLRSGA